MTLNELIEMSHETAKKKGWWDELNPNITAKLMLVVGELSEAVEELRKGDTGETYYEDATCWQCKGLSVLPESERCDPCGNKGFLRKPCGFDIELADAVIRIADLCGYLGIDLEEAILEKQAYNEKRPYRHGKAF